MRGSGGRTTEMMYREKTKAAAKGKGHVSEVPVLKVNPLFSVTSLTPY